MGALIVLWLFLAMIIGWLGRNLRFRFWGYFFASILLTPVIGLLLLIAAVPVKPKAPRVVTRVVKK
jgi:NADH:ubiquinone oxidoreductase subunit 6 (subunit J)